jgi:hypothetical protein
LAFLIAARCCWGPCSGGWGALVWSGLGHPCLSTPLTPHHGGSWALDLVAWMFGVDRDSTPSRTIPESSLWPGAKAAALRSVQQAGWALPKLFDPSVIQRLVTHFLLAFFFLSSSSTTTTSLILPCPHTFLHRITRSNTSLFHTHTPTPAHEPLFCYSLPTPACPALLCPALPRLAHRSPYPGPPLLPHLHHTPFPPPSDLSLCYLSQSLPTMSSTAAQEEFNDLISKNTHRETLHPEDRNDPDNRPDEDLDEEDQYLNAQIDAAMRMTTAPTQLQLPPATFDSNHSTGVKGVINDARNYESARKNKWMNRVRAARRSVFGLDGFQGQNITTNTSGNRSRSDSETDDDANSNDEESFLQEWRESRRRELESEANKTVRTRRTSPSVRVYGRLDEVDALGYLDAIEKVNRDTTVVVFVYDHAVSHTPILSLTLTLN